MRRLATVLAAILIGGFLSVEAQQESIRRYDIGDSISGTSSARAINGKHTVVGSAVTDEGKLLMFTWNFTRGLRMELANASPQDINDRGQVVGSVICPDSDCPQYGFVWTRSSGLRNLGNFRPSAINEVGDMAGLCQSSQRACAMIAGRLYVIHSAISRATDINDQGLVSGWRWSTTTGRAHPFVWSLASGRRTLDDTPWDHGYAEALNDYGQVVGALAEETDPNAPDDIPATVAVRWRSTGRVLASYRDNTWALGIENHGWVVGYGGSAADPTDRYYPILWRNGVVTRLPIGTYLGGIAWDMNESGVIAGTILKNEEQQSATVWQIGRW